MLYSSHHVIRGTKTTNCLKMLDILAKPFPEESNLSLNLQCQPIIQNTCMVQAVASLEGWFTLEEII